MVELPQPTLFSSSGGRFPIPFMLHPHPESISERLCVCTEPVMPVVVASQTGMI